MGKKGDLWDDSALINAFDDAISKYKVMHGNDQPGISMAGREAVNGPEEGFSTCVDGDNDTSRQLEVDGNNNAASHTTRDLNERSNDSQNKENQQQSDWNSSYVQNEQDACQRYLNTQGAEDYNKLLNQYYEIEEQRQKIMQQLQHYNYWTCQEHGSSSQWGNWGSQQQHPVPEDQANQPAISSRCCQLVANQANDSAIASPCCIGASQCVVAPCYLGGTCGVTSGVTYNEQDSDVTKAALTAAQKAISSLKIETSAQGEEGHEEQLETSFAGETDLNAVFNAWYTAGFHTGKYLGEHSIAKKRLG